MGYLESFIDDKKMKIELRSSERPKTFIFPVFLLKEFYLSQFHKYHSYVCNFYVIIILLYNYNICI